MELVPTLRGTAEVLPTRLRRASRLPTRRGVVLAAAVLGLAACDPSVTVKGIVREGSGGPLEDVTVTLRTDGREPDVDKTNSDGKFNVGIVGADPQKTSVSFTKAGFQETVQIVGQEERRTMDVTLLHE